jgi:hypothetical protein
MTKEIPDSGEQISFLSQKLSIGIALPTGTHMHPGITRLLVEIRTLLPQSRITALTYSRYWGELDLFDSLDDVAAVSDDNRAGMAKLTQDRDLDLLFEIDVQEPAQSRRSESASDIWADSLHAARSLKFASGAYANIYVKNRAIAPALQAALDVLENSPGHGGGVLSREILREIELAAPIDSIALFPWARGGRQGKTSQPLDQWVIIAHRLIEAGFEIQIPGTAEDYSAAIAFKDAIGMPGVRLSAGRATLRQTAILLGRMRGAICAPGSMAHLVALAGTPLVVFDQAQDCLGGAAAVVASLMSMLPQKKIGA